MGVEKECRGLAECNVVFGPVYADIAVYDVYTFHRAYGCAADVESRQKRIPQVQSAVIEHHLAHKGIGIDDLADSVIHLYIDVLACEVDSGSLDAELCFDRHCRACTRHISEDYHGFLVSCIVDDSACSFVQEHSSEGSFIEPFAIDYLVSILDKSSLAVLLLAVST